MAEQDLEGAILMREIILQQDLRALNTARHRAVGYELAAEAAWSEVRRLEIYSASNQTQLAALRAQRLVSLEVM